MPSNQVPRIETLMDIVRTAKELRERASWLIVVTRHNPELGIMAIGLNRCAVFITFLVTNSTGRSGAAYGRFSLSVLICFL